MRTRELLKISTVDAHDAFISLKAAKESLDAAKAQVIVAEQLLIQACDFSKTEGTQTYEIFAPNDGAMVGKFLVTAKNNRTVDGNEEELSDLYGVFSEAGREDLFPFKEGKSLVDVTLLKRLRKEEPELYRNAAALIISKPAKTSVSLK